MSGHFPGQPDVDQDQQLALYQIGVQQEFRDATQVYVYVTVGSVTLERVNVLSGGMPQDLWPQVLRR